MSIKLHGEFVTLRPLTPADAAMTLAWRQCNRAINLNRGAQTLEQQAAWLGSRPAGEYNFAITLKTSGQPVGTVSLLNIEVTHFRAESGRFLIGEEDAVRGIPAAVEAMKLLYELAFNELKLLKIYGSVVSDNPLMLKWQKFLGMKEEGRLRQHYFINGHFQDAVMLGLLADEYRKEALPRMNMLIAAGRGRAVKATARTN